MTRTIMSDEDLSKIIDECITDLESGGSKLFDLAQLFHCLGGTCNDYFDALVPTIGSYAGEVISFRPYVALPIIPDDERKKYQQQFDEALKAGKKALEIMKNELCKKSSPDTTEIVKAIAMLAKHDYNLAMVRNALHRRSEPPIHIEPE